MAKRRPRSVLILIANARWTPKDSTSEKSNRYRPLVVQAIMRIISTV